MKTKRKLKFLSYIIFSALFSITLISCEKNSNGNNEDSTIVFGDGTVDIDGNQYTTVIIGTQEWMAENLRVTKYRNGDVIQNASDDLEWSDNTTGAFCWYDNSHSVWGDKYGALYNYHSIADERGLCPIGWVVPDDSDWKQLIEFLGDVPFAGGKLKSETTEPNGHPRWDDPNDGASNVTGFSAFPGGLRKPNGEFENIGKYGFWWSATEWTNNENLGVQLRYYDGSIITPDVYSDFKNTGFSIRCIKE